MGRLIQDFIVNDPGKKVMDRTPQAGGLMQGNTQIQLYKRKMYLTINKLHINAFQINSARPL